MSLRLALDVVWPRPAGRLALGSRRFRKVRALYGRQMSAWPVDGADAHCMPPRPDHELAHSRRHRPAHDGEKAMAGLFDLTGALPPHVPPELAFDYEEALGPTTLEDPYAPARRVFETLPPVFYSRSSNGMANGSGTWVCSRYEDIREV